MRLEKVKRVAAECGPPRPRLHHQRRIRANQHRHRAAAACTRTCVGSSSSAAQSAPSCLVTCPMHRSCAPPASPAHLWAVLASRLGRRQCLSPPPGPGGRPSQGQTPSLPQTAAPPCRRSSRACGRCPARAGKRLTMRCLAAARSWRARVGAAALPLRRLPPPHLHAGVAGVAEAAGGQQVGHDRLAAVHASLGADVKPAARQGRCRLRDTTSLAAAAAGRGMRERRQAGGRTGRCRPAKRVSSPAGAARRSRPSTRRPRGRHKTPSPPARSTAACMDTAAACMPALMGVARTCPRPCVYLPTQPSACSRSAWQTYRRGK